MSPLHPRCDLCDPSPLNPKPLTLKTRNPNPKPLCPNSKPNSFDSPQGLNLKLSLCQPSPWRCRDLGLGFGVWTLGFGVWGLGFREGRQALKASNYQVLKPETVNPLTMNPQTTRSSSPMNPKTLNKAPQILKQLRHEKVLPVGSPPWHLPADKLPKLSHLDSGGARLPLKPDRTPL